MDDLVAAIQEQYGYPADMVMRSAQARAQADGVGVEAILAAWAGVDAPAASAAAPSQPASQPAAAAPAPVAAEPAAPAAEVLEPTVPPPDTETEPEPEPEPEPRLDKSLVASVPGWMVAAFVVVPLLALLYAVWVPNGPGCGDASQLAIDPATGVAENCDGSPFGVDLVNFFAQGQAIYEARCSACHGSDGGGGAGPAFANGAVLAAFPSGTCDEHTLWIDLGSAGWETPTYGALEKPVGGFGANMPGFGGVLTDEELAAVSLYERVQFGGQDLMESETDCGLVVAAE